MERMTWASRILNAFSSLPFKALQFTQHYSPCVLYTQRNFPFPCTDFVGPFCLEYLSSSPVPFPALARDHFSTMLHAVIIQHPWFVSLDTEVLQRSPVSILSAHNSKQVWNTRCSVLWESENYYNPISFPQRIQNLERTLAAVIFYCIS